MITCYDNVKLKPRVIKKLETSSEKEDIKHLELFSVCK